MTDRPGWMSQEELSAIRTCAREVGDKDPTFLEIGTYCGRSTEALLRANPKAHVFTVDALVQVPDGLPPREIRSWIWTLVEEHSPRVTFIPGASRDLIWSRPLSLLLLDGSHTYEDVKLELDRLAHLIVPGGYLLLDDMTPPYPGVRRAWEEYALRHEFKPARQVGKLGIFRRAEA